MKTTPFHYMTIWTLLMDTVVCQFTWLHNFNYTTMIQLPLHSWDKHYPAKVHSLRNYTLDEKCEQGLGIGVGYQIYDPYVKIGRNETYFLAGMFPHLLKTMIGHCCPRSKVEYGKFLTSIGKCAKLYHIPFVFRFIFSYFG